MANCKRCGRELEPDARFCPGCGLPVSGGTGNGSAADEVRARFDDVVEQFRNMEDDTAQFSPQEIRDHRVMAIFAYLGPLVLVPLFADPNSRFTRFHVNQGLALFLASIAYGIARRVVLWIFEAVWWAIASPLRWALNLVGLIFVVYIVLGVVHAARGEAKKLPFLGRVKLLK